MSEFKKGETVYVEPHGMGVWKGGALALVLDEMDADGDYFLRPLGMGDRPGYYADRRHVTRPAPDSSGVKVSGLEALREALAEKVTDTFEDGTVFRWVSGDKYTYAAVKAAGRYHLTGAYDFYNVGRATDYEGILDIFARPDVSNIEVATRWEAV